MCDDYQHTFSYGNWGNSDYDMMAKNRLQLKNDEVAGAEHVQFIQTVELVPCLEIVLEQSIQSVRLALFPVEVFTLAPDVFDAD